MSIRLFFSIFRTMLSKNCNFSSKRCPSVTRRNERSSNSSLIWNITCILMSSRSSEVTSGSIKHIIYIDINRVYTTFVRIGINDWHPKCYLSRPDCLVLENLKAQGYCHRPFGARLDLKHMECLMDVLAQLHASSFEAEKHRRVCPEEMEHQLIEQYVVDGGTLAESEFKVINNIHTIISKANIKITFFLSGHQNAPASFPAVSEIP